MKIRANHHLRHIRWIVPLALALVAGFLLVLPKSEPIPVDWTEGEIQVSGAHRGLDEEGSSTLVFVDPEELVNVEADFAGDSPHRQWLKQEFPNMAEETLSGLAESVAQADRILGIQVNSADSFRNSDGKTIDTRYGVTVRDFLKGTGVSSHEIVFPGGVIQEAGPTGEMEERRFDLIGLPQLEVDKRYIVFLGSQDSKKGWTLPIGMFQGIVEVNERTRRALSRFQVDSNAQGQSHPLEEFQDNLQKLRDFNVAPRPKPLRMRMGLSRGVEPTPVLYQPSVNTDWIAGFLLAIALLLLVLLPSEEKISR
ncbi:MAG TPA: hypothetical protein QGG59_01450 [Planctomycetota bacterium]|jgi:hypothetical protein|nr:hypothetical protein [Planctomycetota bacterium]HJM38758.1 hypothetical protein [Planctomycetota bacterium]|tara:strand:+ start:1744 stop:2673 length:930 start_codon:yes stop_codon:yes gene_type:complete